ncbi:MAG TPA: PDZ domain-containing protein [Desulfuromonadales bacterium]|nr:PDZ domain-containing protein [Desulfuromonadales bacterium]
MSSQKTTESTQSTIQHPDHRCSKNYKPWIWTLVVMALVTLVWALYEGSQQEGYVNNFLTKGQKANNAGSAEALPVAGIANVMPVAQAPGAVGDVQTSYHSIIDAVRPAVISIDAAMKNVPTAANQGMIDPNPNDVAFNKIGSGVIIDPRGYVLSSYHVIAGAEALKATLYGPGGAKEYPLKMVKGDLRTDMALLRIQGTGPFPHAALGNSDAARTGDMVLTIGSPFGFEQTVTSGMISSRNRTLQVGDTVYENLIQTDSSINRGSSGGPMLNVRGEVIGINTAIFAPTGVFNGIGFAIPINRAADLVGGVIDFGNQTPAIGGGQLVAWASQGRQVGNAFRLPGGKMITAPHGPLGKCLDCHPQLGEGVGVGAAATPVAYNAATNNFTLPGGQVITPPHTPRGNCLNCHPQIVQQGGVKINADPFLQNGQGMAVNTDPFLQQMNNRGGVAVNVDPFLRQQNGLGAHVNADPFLLNNQGMVVNTDPFLQQQNGMGTHVNADPPLQQQTLFGIPIGAGAGRGKGLFGRMLGGPATGNGQYIAAGQPVVFTDPTMGVALIDADDIVCRQAGMLHPEGVLVTGVAQGGPAALAGIQRGDILLRIAGRKILDTANLNKLLASGKIGRRFDVLLVRNGARQDVRVKTAPQGQKAPGPVQQGAAVFQWPLGATVTPILPAFTTITKTGVYVQSSGGLLAANGLKNGDIIKGINGVQVEDLESFIKATKRADSRRGFTLDVIRSGNSMFLAVKG